MRKILEFLEVGDLHLHLIPILQLATVVELD